MILAQPSVILFDIGGVLVDLDGMPSLVKWLGLAPDHEAIHALWLQSPAVVSHETGRVTAAEFARGVVQDLRLPVSADVFLADFCSWPRAIWPGANELLEAIPSSHRVAALSNTSAPHWNRIEQLGLSKRFDHLYLSHQTGYLKPARAAYEYVLSDLQAVPGDVLFLDDSGRNVEAARQLGIEAHLARNPEEARTVLQQRGVVGAGQNSAATC